MADDIARRAHELLKRAIELESHDRARFVEQQCGDDRQLYKSVMALLGAITASVEFLETPALSGLNSSDKAHNGQASSASSSAPSQESTAPSITSPDAVGDYLIVGVLGVGGMARVYEAIQEHPRRRVALKVLHQSMARTNAYERFMFETEALARLQHPNIAQIYEAGAAPIGQLGPSPFFAMELIPDAVTLTSFVEARGLALDERLEKFIAVCDAIHHGHQHGVIHRDLKPGNVLVDREGRVKVIDFGIARAIGPTGHSLTSTSDARQVIGTLNYMSPEQCDPASDIDIRTDVYSLGVLLHELVYGQLPHDLSSLPLPLALHTIAHEPARKVESAFASVDRDLHAIIHKSIQKRPDDRYDSASALAADLRRWLVDQPVEARPPGVIDQCRLFARRHRALVAGAISVTVSIALLATISVFFVVRLSDEVARRRSAEQQAIDERDLARWQAYTAQIAGALSAMKTSDFVQMRSRLADVSHPKRDWEWGFLSRLAEPSSTVISAHDDMVLDLAFNEDGTRFVTGAADGSIRLWNASDHTMLASFSNPSGARIFSVAFAGESGGILSGDASGVVRLHDSTDLHEIEVVAKLGGSARRVVGLTNNQIAAAGSSGTARVWTLHPRTETTITTDQEGGIQGIDRSPDGTLIATYNDKGHLWIRSAEDFSPIHKLVFPGQINQVRFDAASRMVGAAGTIGQVMVWRVDDGSIMHEIDATGGVNTVRSLAFSTDGALLAAGLVHRGIIIISTSDGSIMCDLGGHAEAVSGLHFPPDDRTLVSCSWDRTIRTWRTEEFGAPGGASLKAHSNQALDVAFSPDGSMLASGSRDGSVILWDPDRASLLARLTDGDMQVGQILFSPDGRTIAAACSDNFVRIWDTLSGTLLEKLAGYRTSVSSIAFNASGTRLAAGSPSGMVRVWNLGTDDEPLDFKAHRGRVNSIQFSPDGRTIATGSRDQSVRMSNALTGESLHELTDHESDVFAVLFSYDGSRLYSGSRDQSIRIWDVATGRCTKSLQGHGQFVTSLALNPAGTRLAAGSWYGEIVLFDVETLDQIASFRAHESAVRGVAFSPDGRWLATASADFTVRLLDSATRHHADAAKHRAMQSHEQALSIAATLVEQMHRESRPIIDVLSESSINPDQQPWVRKAALSIMSSEPGP